jgi:hypothetical protein
MNRRELMKKGFFGALAAKLLPLPETKAETPILTSGTTGRTVLFANTKEVGNVNALVSSDPAFLAVWDNPTITFDIAGGVDTNVLGLCGKNGDRLWQINFPDGDKFSCTGFCSAIDKMKNETQSVTVRFTGEPVYIKSE